MITEVTWSHEVTWPHKSHGMKPHDHICLMATCSHMATWSHMITYVTWPHEVTWSYLPHGHLKSHDHIRNMDT